MSTSMQEPATDRVGNVTDRLRWAVGLKLRSLGDFTYRAGLVVSEGTNAGINDECDVAYLLGRQDAVVGLAAESFNRLDLGQTLALARAADMSCGDLVRRVENELSGRLASVKSAGRSR